MAKSKPAKKSAKKTESKTSAKRSPVQMRSRTSNAESSKAKKGSRSESEGSADIIQMILSDHKPLKKLIKVMKDTDADIDERRAAFEEFCPLLVTHAKPEEQVMYVFMKGEEELRTEGFEGDVEHALADQMIEEAQRADDEDVWSAKVKVLAELVEHHIEEEESELLPDFKKHTEKEERGEMGAEFMRLKSELQEEGSDDSPSEKTMRKPDRQQRLQ